MSFEQNNMDEITLQNYEAFFVLYMDGELDAEGAKSVEDFLIIHPHLQDEMDALLSTKLQPESFSFDKEALFSHSMKQAGLSEDLLLYIDGELDEKNSKALELELKLNDSLRAEHSVLLQTKLDASEVIPYPNKEELYRRTGIISLPFLFRAAAIVLLVLFGSLMLLNNKGTVELPSVAVSKDGVSPVVKKNTEATPSLPPSEEKENNIASTSTPVKASPVRNNKKDNRNIVVNDPAPANSTEAIASLTTDPGKGSDEEEATKRRPATLPQDAFVLNNSFDAVSSIKPGNISPKSDVTFAQPLRTTNDEQLIAVSNESKTGGLKTFFKKATRVIAQKARLDLATDDDKVLIAAIAVDLK